MRSIIAILSQLTTLWVAEEIPDNEKIYHRMSIASVSFCERVVTHEFSQDPRLTSDPDSTEIEWHGT